MNGRTNIATKFGCALACEIIGGAKAQNAPPIAAAVRDCARCREITQYQPAALAATPPVSASAHVTVVPNNHVTGASGIPRPSMAVLAIMFAPSGGFCSVVT